ncbi:MAG TPA: hypothetical protein VNB59_01880 [Solirubrobacterales bacterium]|jgi:hypothetical protein|nr:hypothetical protein [Solirubrobacterales bacterium]
MSELDRHYERLCRVGKGGLWKRAFLGFAVLMAGGVIGAVLAGPGWTSEVKVAALVSVIALIAWFAVHETESEGISNIRQDFKEDILDSIEFEITGQDAEVFSPQEIKAFFDKVKAS